MIAYRYDDQRLFTGNTKVISEGEGLAKGWTRVQPPETSGSQVAQFSAGRWVVLPVSPPSATVPVPFEVSRRQARQQLIVMDIIGNVQPVIAAIADDTNRALVQSFWDDSGTFERSHPQMIELATAIGLSSEQLDNAFIEAAQR